MIILVVEDEFLIADALAQDLIEAGHIVLGPAATVNQGLALIAKTMPDLALINIRLRDGSSGVDLARELTLKHGVPSLFISGQLLEAEQSSDFSFGFIAKPYRRTTILQSIEIVRQISNGESPNETPVGLRLFR